MNIDLIRDYFIKYNTFDFHEEDKETIERILVNADILKESNGNSVCSVGGFLIFGNNIDKYLPQSGVSFAHFKGTDITGRLQDIAEQLLVVLKNNMRTSKLQHIWI